MSRRCGAIVYVGRSGGGSGVLAARAAARVGSVPWRAASAARPRSRRRRQWRGSRAAPASRRRPRRASAGTRRTGRSRGLGVRRATLRACPHDVVPPVALTRSRYVVYGRLLALDAPCDRGEPRLGHRGVDEHAEPAAPARASGARPVHAAAVLDAQRHVREGQAQRQPHARRPCRGSGRARRRRAPSLGAPGAAAPRRSSDRARRRADRAAAAARSPPSDVRREPVEQRGDRDRARTRARRRSALRGRRAGRRPAARGA